MSYEQHVRGIARSLSEIARTLEGADDVDGRVQHVLMLAGELVPNQRCALWVELAGQPPRLYVQPPAPEEERTRLRSLFHRLLGLVGDADEIGPTSDAAAGMSYLTVPLIGLDDVIGLLRVETAAATHYDGTHLRLLSVVGAQLAAYLTMLKLRQDEEERSRELASERDFQRLLIGVVSHDLRNPLSVITMLATQSLEAPQSAEQARAMSRALRSAKRASRIINDLLDVTHARVTGTLSIMRTATDLRAVLEATIEDVRLAHPKRAIDLDIQGDAAKLTGEWDADRVAQATVNLVNNALQHGSAARPVRITVTADDDGIAVAVHNHGAPIDAELVPHLFDPFVHGGQHAHRRGGGLGLGLYIVDQIARAHGGRLEVSSSPEVGTTFVLCLPRHDRRSQADVLRTSTAAPRVSSAAAHVMVVDDDQDIRESTRDLLLSSGYLVTTAANGKDALDLLHGGLRPLLILLDLSMPVMDGEAFLAECKKHEALNEIPILLLTGETATALRLTRSGATYLSKPIEPTQLVKMVQELSRDDRSESGDVRR